MLFNSNYVSISPKIKDDDIRWDHYEDGQKYRSPFAKDRDRILYSRSFLRLRGKTQVFMLKDLDYVRTRLTHTLEVNQIAKTIVSALGLNLDLTEAIAYGHDVGHTPFGHVGERTLNYIMNGCSKVLPDSELSFGERGFKHNLQALRLLCDLEKNADFPDYRGLNLTKYTLWGIAHHSSVKPKSCHLIADKCCENYKDECLRAKTEYDYYDSYLSQLDKYWSFEGIVVSIADEIAQRHHDIEDSLRFGILSIDDIYDKLKELSKKHRLIGNSNIKRLNNKKDDVDGFIAMFSRLIVNMYVVDIVENSKLKLKELGIKYKIGRSDDFMKVKDSILYNEYEGCICFSDKMKYFDNDFQMYLKESVLSSYKVQSMDGKGGYIIRKLFEAYVSNPCQLPDHVINQFCYDAKLESARVSRKNLMDMYYDNRVVMYRSIADYIGGMTDNYAYIQFDLLYGTRV